MSTLTPEDIPRICRELGIKPIRRVPAFVTGTPESPCGCCVGVQLIQRVGFDAAISASDNHTACVTLAHAEELSESFVVGMSDGWEVDYKPDPGIWSHRPKYIDGCRFGRAAWKACVDAGLLGAES